MEEINRAICSLVKVVWWTIASIHLRHLADICREEVSLVLLQEGLYTEGVDQPEALINRMIYVDLLFFNQNLDFGGGSQAKVTDPGRNLRYFAHWFRWKYIGYGFALILLLWVLFLLTCGQGVVDTLRFGCSWLWLVRKLLWLIYIRCCHQWRFLPLLVRWSKLRWLIHLVAVLRSIEGLGRAERVLWFAEILGIRTRFVLLRLLISADIFTC